MGILRRSIKLPLYGLLLLLSYTELDVDVCIDVCSGGAIVRRGPLDATVAIRREQSPRGAALRWRRALLFIIFHIGVLTPTRYKVGVDYTGRWWLLAAVMQVLGLICTNLATLKPTTSEQKVHGAPYVDAAVS